MARIPAWLAVDAAVYRARTKVDVSANDVTGSGGVYQFSVCVITADWYHACD